VGPRAGLDAVELQRKFLLLPGLKEVHNLYELPAHLFLLQRKSIS
jgi:hypothetical protein